MLSLLKIKTPKPISEHFKHRSLQVTWSHTFILFKTVKVGIVKMVRLQKSCNALLLPNFDCLGFRFARLLEQTKKSLFLIKFAVKQVSMRVVKIRMRSDP